MSELTFDIFGLIKQLLVLQTGRCRNWQPTWVTFKTIRDTIDGVGQSYLRVTDSA